MTIPPTILANGSSDGFEIIAALVFVLIAIVGGIIKKIAQKQQEARQRGLQEQQGSVVPPPRPPHVSRPHAHVHRPGVAAAPPHPPPFQLDTVIPLPLSRHIASAIAEYVTLEPLTQTESIRVSQELQLQQQRSQELEERRMKKLAARVPQEADSAGIEARLLHTRPSAAPHLEPSAPRAKVVLGDAEQARFAIICHEVFSPPKALRQESEPWEL